MADLIKKIKIKKQDGTFTDYIPIGAEAQNISTNDGDSVQLKLNKKPYYYNSVADMKADTKLKAGDMAITLGYYEVNDGGHGEYVIVDDDTLVSDDGSIHILSNGLRAKLIVDNEINVKQFGAKGNGIDLDNTPLLNALNYIKNSDIKVLYFNDGNYLLSNKIYLPSGKYIGLGSATLTETNSTDEVFITNEHFLDYDYQDEIEIKDLTIVKTTLSGGSLKGKRCFRFACTNNLHMDNIIMKSNVDSQFGAIDLYSYNTNALIENCKVYKTGTLTATSLVGGYAVREYSETHTSKNISIINCLIDKDGIDESLWISGWFGNLEHVYVNNMKIYDRTNSEGVTTCFIDRCSDVTIENSYIYKLGNGYKLIQIGTNEEHHQRLVENLFINNNVFEIENSSNTSQYCSFIRVDSLVGSRGVFIQNNKFYFNGTNNTKIGCFYIFNESATIKSINNIFNGNCQQLGFNVKYSINDTLNGNCSNTIFENPEYIKEFKNNGTTPYFYKLALNNAVRNNIKIENCDVVANRIFQNNGSTITTTHTFINSNLINTQEFEADFTLSNDTKQTLNIFNCNIGHLPISWEKYNILNVNNLTLNNVLVKGIPTSAKDRYNYPIGTVFFSGTPTKSIVRKISDGDSTSNWEEI